MRTIIRRNKHCVPVIAERIREKIFYCPSGCHLWTGKTNDKGYGELTSFRKVLKVHRLSYEIRFGKIPEGIDVLHSCDNPLCVNPDHLRIGTHLENMRDKVERNRQHRPTGTSNPKCKLGVADVIEIKKLISEGYNTQKSIAAHYGVSRATISLIRNNLTWTHLK